MAPRRKKKKKKKDGAVEDVLHGLYYDPAVPGSYGGVDALYRAAKQQRPDVKRDEVEAWLAEQDTYTLHKPVRYKFPRRRVVVGGIDHQWQADLADVSSLKKYNDGNAFLLTVIDVFSKYAWAVPIARKTQTLVAGAFESIFAQGRKPLVLQTDQGTEFLNDTVRKLLKKEGVQFFTTFSVETKASVVERFNRTLKTRMWRYFTEHQTRRYMPILQQLVDAYNHTRHRSIGMAPADVNTANEEKVWQRLYASKAGRRLLKGKPHEKENNKKKKKKKPSVQVGDWVRLSKSRRTFKKGYLPNWTEELFSVIRSTDTDPPQYLVQDYQGEEIKGGMYAHEVQKVNKADEIYRVEKILDDPPRPTRDGKGRQVKVRWLGYGPKFDSWVDEADILGYLRRSHK